jgi:hypothetical protein
MFSDFTPVADGAKRKVKGLDLNCRVLAMVYSTRDYCGFGLCPSSGNAEDIKNKMFQKIDLFPSLVMGWKHFQSSRLAPPNGPNRESIFHSPTHDDGNKCRFRNGVLFTVL